VPHLRDLCSLLLNVRSGSHFHDGKVEISRRHHLLLRRRRRRRRRSALKCSPQSILVANIECCVRLTIRHLAFVISH